MRKEAKHLEEERVALEFATHHWQQERSRLEKQTHLLEDERQLLEKEGLAMRQERERWEKARDELTIPKVHSGRPSCPWRIVVRTANANTGEPCATSLRAVLKCMHA